MIVRLKSGLREVEEREEEIRLRGGFYGQLTSESVSSIVSVKRDLSQEQNIVSGLRCANHANEPKSFQDMSTRFFTQLDMDRRLRLIELNLCYVKSTYRSMPFRYF